jgi:hypothetical protein
MAALFLEVHPVAHVIGSRMVFAFYSPFYSNILITQEAPHSAHTTLGLRAFAFLVGVVQVLQAKVSSVPEQSQEVAHW